MNDDDDDDKELDYYETSYSTRVPINNTNDAVWLLRSFQPEVWIIRSCSKT